MVAVKAFFYAAETEVLQDVFFFSDLILHLFPDLLLVLILLSTALHILELHYIPLVVPW